MVWIYLGFLGSGSSFRRSRPTKTRRYSFSDEYSLPQTLCNSMLWVSTLSELTARCCSREYSVGVRVTGLLLTATRRLAKFISRPSQVKFDCAGETVGSPRW